MTTPVSIQWNVLNFEDGMDISATGENWFVTGGGSGEGIDWLPTPAGGWGSAYGRPSATTFYMTPSGNQFLDIDPTAQGINPILGTPYTVLDRLEGQDWEFRAVATPSNTGSVLSCYCGRASDGVGVAIRISHLTWPSGYYLTQWWDGANSTWTNIPTTVPFTAVGPISIRMIYLQEANTVQIYIQGILIDEVPAGEYLLGVTAGGGPLSTVGLLGFSFGTVQWTFSSWQIGTHPYYGSLKPVAHAGMDRVSPLGRWVGFNAKNSKAGDGSTDLTYSWKLVLAPSTSSFVYQANDGEVIDSSTFESLSTIFQNTFGPTPTLFAIGDVLIIQGVPYEILEFIATGGFGAPANQVRVRGVLPAGYTGVFQVIYQSNVQGSVDPIFSFEPDVKGLYAAFLTVTDYGGMPSEPDFAVCNVIDDNVPLGVPLDMSWLWNYLGDFWKLAVNKEYIHSFWMGLTRQLGSVLQEAWNADFDKSLSTTQNVIGRRWLMEHPSYYEQDQEATTFTDKRCPAFSVPYWDYWDITTGTVPIMFPWTITIHMFVETSMLSLDVVIPGGTAFSTVPALVEAACATASATYPQWSMIHCNYRLANQVNNDPASAHIGEQYGMAIWSDSYLIDVSDTATYFVGPVTNTFQPSGGYLASRLSATTVRLPTPDLDSRVKVGDILNLGGRSFEILGIQRKYLPTTPPYGFLDVEVAPEIPETGFDSALYWCIPSYWTSLRTPWYDAGVTSGDLLYVDVRADAEPDSNPTRIALEVAGAGSRKIGTVDYRAFFPDLALKLDHARRHFYTAVPTNLLEMPRLQQDVDNPTWIMEEFKDYVVDSRRNGRFIVLDFRNEPLNEIERYTIFRNRATVSFLNDWLWAEIAYFDNRKTVENNFGRMVNVYVEDFAAIPDANYLSVITNLWHAYSTGPTPENLDTGSAIIGGYPYAEAAGTILQIVEDFVSGYSYAFIRDDDQTAIVRSYVFQTGKGIAINPDTGVAYTNGDHIERFKLLVQGQVVFNYLDDPDWWKSIRTSGIVSEVEKVHRFGVMLDVDYLNSSLLDEITDLIMDLKKVHTYPIVAGYSFHSDDIEIEDTPTTTAVFYIPTALWSYPVPPDLDVPRTGSGTRFEPQYPSDADSEILVRMPDVGGTYPAGGTGVRLRLEPAASASTMVGGSVTAPRYLWDIIGYFEAGVTTAADMVALLNTSPGPGDYIVAYLPPGAIFQSGAADGPGFRLDARTLGTPSLTFEIVLDVAASLDETGAPAVVLHVVDGVTTVEDAIALINGGTLLTATPFIADLPEGAGLTWTAWGPASIRSGSGHLVREIGWHEVNPRGRYQLSLDAGGTWASNGSAAAVEGPAYNYPWVLDYASKHVSFNGDTVLSEDVGGNVLDPVTTIGFAHRVKLSNLNPQAFHDGSVPAVTQLRPNKHWLVFFDGVTDAYKSMGVVLGNEEATPASITGAVDIPALLMGKTITITIGAPDVSTTVTFAGPNPYTPQEAADEVTTALVAAGVLGYASVASGKMRITTGSSGAAAYVIVTGGAILGFTSGSVVWGKDAITPDPLAPNFSSDVNDNWVDVWVTGTAPVAGDSFVVFEGMPDRTVMDFSIATADTYLPATFTTNALIGVTPGLFGSYQVQVDAAHRFSTVGGPHLLIPNEDYLLFFDSLGKLTTLGKLTSVDNGAAGDLATISIVADSQTGLYAPEPVVGYFFVVLRNPPFTWANVSQYTVYHLGMRSLGFERGPFAGTITVT